MATETTATASKVHLGTENQGTLRVTGKPAGSFEAASRFLQKNHDEHHIFWREVAGHNHIAHSVLSVFALGGSPSDIQRAFEDGAEIQRPLRTQTEVKDLADPQQFRAKMGNLNEYPSFLAFFEAQIEEKGWQEVVKEYVFGKTPNAETIFSNLLEGLYHPLIHVGLGIEFAQPSIIAEGLSQAASHDSMAIEEFLSRTEQEARTSTRPKKPLVQLYQDLHSIAEVRANVQGFTDGASRVRDGVIGRSSHHIVPIAAQFRLAAGDLDHGLAETTNVSAFATGDFFHMHGVTASILLEVFLKQSWIPEADKVRLLERKARVDLVWYAASGAVELRHETVKEYSPQANHGLGWDELYEKVVKEHDDGHLAKLVRALRNGQELSKPFEKGSDSEAFPIKGKEWLKIAQLGYESTANRPIEQKWVWGAGFEECWGLIPSDQ
ncbi:hypothetical protein K491DRAFT_708672 [Lophiostoma macrostomum CBS 122681]|uniref:HypA-like protein n=1 Tax=Lophiostoma macrostomum CBS 122681 TaxID=1314788 RepID=A0A6A6SL85_9PLEO|nr:hypothetical protein K491DRAFT_708672 [Lophiostoma macrostomum CBS 122681]